MSATDQEQTNNADAGGRPEDVVVAPPHDDQHGGNVHEQEQKTMDGMDVANEVAPAPIVHNPIENQNNPVPAYESNHHEAPAYQGNHHEEKDTSAMIAEAAAAAVAAVNPEPGDVDAATAAALAVKTEEEQDQEDPSSKKRSFDQHHDTEDASSKADSSINKAPKTGEDHEQQLAARRQKDRERYANMTAEQRQMYNQKRREQYHRQSERSRQKRRERERQRYHSLSADAAKERNARRAKLERERYQRLTAAELEARNRKRRERAAAARARKNGSKASDASVVSTADTTQSGGYQVKQEETQSGKAADLAVAEEAINEAMKEAEAAAQNTTGVVQL